MSLSPTRTQLLTAVSEEKEKNLQLVRGHEQTLHQRVTERIQSYDTATRQRYEGLLQAQKEQTALTIQQCQDLSNAYKEHLSQLSEDQQHMRAEMRRLQRQHTAHTVWFLLALAALSCLALWLCSRLADSRSQCASAESTLQLACERRVADLHSTMVEATRRVESLDMCVSALTDTAGRAREALEGIQAVQGEVEKAQSNMWWPVGYIVNSVTLAHRDRIASDLALVANALARAVDMLGLTVAHLR